MNEEFNNLVKLFKNMTLQEKKNALINEFKVNLAAIEKINEDLGIKHQMLINREVLDVLKEDATDDDFLEAYYVYLNMIQHSFGAFAEKIANDFFE